MSQPAKKTILVADDDQFLISDYVDRLQQAGYRVITAATGTEVLETIKRQRGAVSVAVLDIMMRWGNRNRKFDSGVLTGLTVAKEIKRMYPKIKLIGFSVLRDESLVSWFHKYGDGFLSKSANEDQLLDAVHYALHGRMRRKPKCFVVHGQDEGTLSDFKHFLRNELGISDIVILREQPNLGRTIIEKFEDTASEVDLAFVLLTPDDMGFSKKSPSGKRRRARQNVIFELGFFYAIMQRKKGRVILLYKGNLELPTDISGIVYIDISRGIKNVRKLLRGELREWL